MKRLALKQKVGCGQLKWKTTRHLPPALPEPPCPACCPAEGLRCGRDQDRRARGRGGRGECGPFPAQLHHSRRWHSNEMNGALMGGFVQAHKGWPASHMPLLKPDPIPPAHAPCLTTAEPTIHPHPSPHNPAQPHDRSCPPPTPPRPRSSRHCFASRPGTRSSCAPTPAPPSVPLRPRASCGTQVSCLETNQIGK